MIFGNLHILYVKVKRWYSLLVKGLKNHNKKKKVSEIEIEKIKLNI